MTLTLAHDLLAPYRDYLAQTSEQPHYTVAEALIRTEARHIATIRNEQGEPRDGGWKNKLPLEHNSPLGFFFKACRTGDKSFIREKAKSHPDQDTRAIYSTLCNAENVYIDVNRLPMTTDQLIAYAASEIDND